MSDNENTRSVAGSRMDGKVVILTGAAGNIGTSYPAACCVRARLVMTGRNERQAHGVYRRARSEGFDRACMVPAAGDGADPRVCREIVATAVEHFGKIDVLINNAGAAGTAADAARHPLLRGGDARPRR
jgi:malonyl-CoA reductase/3-hydroxypropionate dehydrogenase (NADP+)